LLFLFAGCNTVNRGDSRGQTANDDGFDGLDLTQLSSTVLSAEINKIYRNPSDYLGMMVKVSGVYFLSLSLSDNQAFHYIITKAGDACCMEGFEFILAETVAETVGYPVDQARIEVIGILSEMEMEGMRYYYLDVREWKEL
jgi:hypothetical protein